VFVYGRELTVAELLIEVAKVFCSSNCKYDNLEKSIVEFAKLMKTIDDALAFAASGDGCVEAKPLGDLDIDRAQFNLPNGMTMVKRTPYLENKTKKRSVSAWETQLNTAISGDFGFKFHLFENPLDKFMSLLFGNEIPVIGVTIPKMSVAITATWTYPVWPVPPVFLFVQFEASAALDIGEIALSSKGIADMLRTGQPGKSKSLC